MVLNGHLRGVTEHMCVSTEYNDYLEDISQTTGDLEPPPVQLQTLTELQSRTSQLQKKTYVILFLLLFFKLLYPTIP